MSEYFNFLEARRHVSGYGFRVEPDDLPEWLFPFQRALVSWALGQGRAAVFADCGLGKTPMQLVWAQRVAEETGGRVLVITPLAVGQQTLSEAEKFGIAASRSQDGRLDDQIVITNYERLGHFKPADFTGVVCDESSILKCYDGKRRAQITQFMRKHQYRLLCTATAAPNDFIELGTSSEALGYLGYVDMLTKFFINADQNISQRREFGKAKLWRFKGHGQEAFWRWVVSWARACRTPSDLGFTDDRFALPPLVEREHEIEAKIAPEGWLFEKPAETLWEQRAERRRTIQQRCERVAELVGGTEPALVWCDLNDEGNILEKLIPGAVQVAGADSDDVKEERLIGFARGDYRVLVTKPKIGAWGLNFQHCAHVTFFPSHSYEQFYQGVRRCWRFGQTRPVHVDLVTTEGSHLLLKNLRRKAADASKMFATMVHLMNQAASLHQAQEFTSQERIPAWL